MEQHLFIAESIALEAGKIMLAHFNIGVDHTIKEDKTPLTEADKKINQLALQTLEKSFPDYSLLGEEGSKIKPSEYVWVFDAIDGTVPFLRGIPINTCPTSVI